MNPPRPHTSPLLWLLILIAAAKLLLRGLLPFTSGGTDFAWVWSNALLWRQGGNPYSLPSGLAVYFQNGGAALWPLSDRYGSVYPPSLWPALWPFTFLSRPSANLAWDLLSVALIFTAIIALIRRLRLAWSTALMSVLLILAFSPLRLSLRLGQPGLLAFALTLIALHLVLSKRPLFTGVLLGFALAIKFQIALPLLAVLLLKRDWRAVAFTFIIATGFFAIGTLKLEHAQPGALALWFNNLHFASQPGSTADISLASPDRYLMIHLQVPLRAIVDSPIGASIISVLIACVLLLKWLRPPTTNADTLLTAGAIGVISLLPFYHRPYDIVLAIPLLLWAAAELQSPFKAARRYASAILLILALFLGPEADVLQSLAAHNRLPLSVIQSPLRQPFILCWQTWALLLLAIVLSFRRLQRPALQPPASIF